MQRDVIDDNIFENISFFEMNFLHITELRFVLFCLAVVDVCMTLLAASGLASNALVLVVFYRCPALRSPSNR